MKQAADTSPTKKGDRRSKKGRKAPTTDDKVAAATAATLKETDEATTPVVAAAAATITTATTVEVSSEDIRNANAASGSPISWESHNFTHDASSKVSVTQVINNVSEVEYIKANNHPSGNIYLLSHEQLRDKDIQGKLLSDIIPELIQMVTEEGFDVNRIEEKQLLWLYEASKKHFTKDYANNDDKNKMEKVGGSVYLKFIVMTVGDWITCCKHLLRGDKRHCTGRDKMFITRLLAKLELGIEESWWNTTETYSIPYIGESSAQTFWMRMSNYYPPLYKAIMEKSGDTRKTNFEIKVGHVSPNNAVQSRALECLVATLLSRCTQRSRQTAKPTEDEYARCRCLRDDGSGLNDAICGDRVGFGKFVSFDGYRIYEWFANAVHAHRNVPILDCPLRNATIVEYLLANVKEICDYINNTSRENASRAVRSNKGAPSGKRVDASHITVEDGFRFWGYTIGNATLRDEKGIHNPDWIELQQHLELDDAFEALKKEYADDNNFYDGYFFPDKEGGSILYLQFLRIRKGSYACNDFRREFFLSKKEFELEHLLYDSKYQEASKKKNDFVNYGAERKREVDQLMQNDSDNSSESSMAVAEDSSGSDID